MSNYITKVEVNTGKKTFSFKPPELFPAPYLSKKKVKREISAVGVQINRLILDSSVSVTDFFTDNKNDAAFVTASGLLEVEVTGDLITQKFYGEIAGGSPVSGHRFSQDNGVTWSEMRAFGGGGIVLHQDGVEVQSEATVLNFGEGLTVDSEGNVIAEPTVGTFLPVVMLTERDQVVPVTPCSSVEVYIKNVIQHNVTMGRTDGKITSVQVLGSGAGMPMLIKVGTNMGTFTANLPAPMSDIELSEGINTTSKTVTSAQLSTLASSGADEVLLDNSLATTYWNMDASKPNASILLNSNKSIELVGGVPVAGTAMSLRVIQDDIGGFNLSFDESKFGFPNGVIPNLTDVAGKSAVLHFHSAGNGLILIGIAQGLEIMVPNGVTTILGGNTFKKNADQLKVNQGSSSSTSYYSSILPQTFVGSAAGVFRGHLISVSGSVNRSITTKSGGYSSFKPANSDDVDQFETPTYIDGAGVERKFMSLVSGVYNHDVVTTDVNSWFIGFGVSVATDLDGKSERAEGEPSTDNDTVMQSITLDDGVNPPMTLLRSDASYSLVSVRVLWPEEGGSAAADPIADKNNWIHVRSWKWRVTYSSNNKTPEQVAMPAGTINPDVHYVVRAKNAGLDLKITVNLGAQPV